MSSEEIRQKIEVLRSRYMRAKIGTQTERSRFIEDLRAFYEEVTGEKDFSPSACFGCGGGIARYLRKIQAYV